MLSESANVSDSGRPMSARQLTSPPSACDFGAPGTYEPNPSRFLSCSDVIWELYTYDRHEDGTVTITGWLNLENFQWTIYSADALTWTHGLEIGIYTAGGTLAGGTSASVVSLCGASVDCSADPLGTQPVELAPFTSFTTMWTEVDTGPASQGPGQETFQDLLGVSIESPGTEEIPPWTFQDSYLVGRCDSIVRGTVGCVNQEFTPTLEVSVSTYGAAADMIRWAQTNLQGAWGRKGSGQPLHRLASESEAESNRRIICKDGSFTRDEAMTEALAPYQDRDSCDEFPFARSYESGALNGVTSGAQCAQVTAMHTDEGKGEAADWAAVEPLGTPTGSEACVRGHIPGKLNSAVGGALSGLTRSKRLVDADPYWVSVTD